MSNAHTAFKEALADGDPGVVQPIVTRHSAREMRNLFATRRASLAVPRRSRRPR